MEPYLWPIVLLVLGLLFVFLEIFVPSGGVLSLFAAGSIVASIVLAFLESMFAGTVMLIAATVFVPLAISLAVRWWPRTPLGKAVLIRRPESDDEVLPDTEEYHRDRLIGKTGIAKCNLLPSGDVQIDGRLYDAVSNGPAIDRGEAIRVVDVNTQRLVVRSLTESEKRQESPDDVLSTPLDSLGIEPFDEPLA